MAKSMILALLATTAPLAESGGTMDITWTDCGDASTHGKVTSLQPTSLTIGTAATLTGTGSVDKDISGGSFKISMKAGFIKKTWTGNICEAKAFTIPLGLGTVTWDGMACPVAQGVTSVPIDVKMSSSIPASLATADISATAKTSDGENLICMNVHMAKASVPDYYPPNKMIMFQQFMEKHQKIYWTESEMDNRFKIFSENVDKIYASNAQNKKYTLGITANADQTFEEWRAVYLTGLKPALTAERKGRPIFTAPKGFTAPDSVDWVSKGGVTDVKNQGTCGSCWAFSTIGALEGAMFVAGRKLQDLSMQNLLACDDESQYGCNGGMMDQGFDWVAKNGLFALKDDPYLCTDASSSQCKNQQCSACSVSTGQGCLFGSCDGVPGSECAGPVWSRYCECPAGQCFADGKCGAGVTPTKVLAPGDVVKHTDVDQSENALEAAVAQQPVSIAIEADQSVFQHYTSGVLTDDSCGTSLDHGVLVVGYGTMDGTKYWKVKNSWSPTWGDNGYIYIERGDANQGGECGIREMASFPTIKSSGNGDVIV